MASKFSLILTKWYEDAIFTKWPNFFYSAAEIFSHSGRKMLKSVGNTAWRARRAGSTANLAV
jgi:hypothetical protein